VTVIEATKLANGASGKAGGLLAAWAFPNNLAKLSFDLHNKLAQDHNGTELWGYRRVRCGQLSAVASQRRDARRLENPKSGIDLGKYWPRESQNSSLLPEDLDWLDNNSANAYEEFADTDSTAQLYPWQFTNTIAGLAEEKGAKIILGRVKQINCCDIRNELEIASPLAASDNLTEKKVVSVTYVDKVTSEQITVPATTIVLAAGPWTTTLFPNIRIRPLRAHSVTFRLQRPIAAYCLFSDIQLTAGSPPLSIEIYARPNNEVYICSKGDMNVPLPPPSKAVEVSSDTCQDMINAATSVSEDFRAGQVTSRRACYLPVLDAGQNSNPLVGKSELAGLVIATGHSCWGISNAPGTGKAISELIFEGNISCIDATGLDPSRSF
jgi:glycine/D-amino acid oxidase-like deaminating enzyme